MESEGHLCSYSAHLWGWFVWLYIISLQSSVQTSCQSSKLQAWLHRWTSPRTAQILQEPGSPVHGKQLYWVEVRCEILMRHVTGGWLSFIDFFLGMTSAINGSPPTCHIPLNNLLMSSVNSGCCKSETLLLHKVADQKKSNKWLSNLCKAK